MCIVAQLGLCPAQCVSTSSSSAGGIMISHPKHIIYAACMGKVNVCHGPAEHDGRLALLSSDLTRDSTNKQVQRNNIGLGKKTTEDKHMTWRQQKTTEVGEGRTCRLIGGPWWLESAPRAVGRSPWCCPIYLRSVLPRSNTVQLSKRIYRSSDAIADPAVVKLKKKKKQSLY